MAKKIKHPPDDDKSRAIEQQLKATIQQLQASEQQLRAANQQLRASEEQMREMEQNWRASFNSLEDVMILIDRNFNVEKINANGLKLIGKSEEDIVGRKCYEVLHGLSAPTKGCPLKKSLKTKKVESIDHFEEDFSRHFSIKSSPILDEKGKIVRFVDLMRDITERKKAEQALRKSEQEKATILKTISEHVVYRDMKMRVLWANRAAGESVGLAPEQLVGRYCYEIWHHRSKPCVVCPAKQALKSGRPEEMDIVTPDGRIWRIRAYPIRDTNGNIVGIANVTLEITERKKAEQVLYQEHSYLEKLIDHSNVPIIVWDPNFRVTRFNHAFERLTGYTADEVIGQKLSILFPKASREESLRNIKRTLSGEYWESVEIPILCKNKQVRLALWNSANIYDEDGTTLLATIAQGQDITERKKAEEALKATNQQLRASEQQLKATNQQLQASEQQLKATNQQLRASEQQFRAANQQLQASEQQLKAANQQLQASQQQLLAYQRQLKSLASQLTLTEEHERHRVATDLHATIGQNLVISKLRLDALHASAPSGGDLARTLEEVCNLLDETVRQTRTLVSDLSSPTLYELGFEMAVAEWLDERIREKHDIACEFEDDNQPKPLDNDIRVLLFRNIRELLINVVKHARASKVKVSVSKSGSQIEVSVEDNGWGFDPKEITARGTKKGGFGLFSIRERLEQLGGHFDIKSAPGQGCKVTMMAPLKEENIKSGG